MPRVEPTLVPVVVDLERGLRELGVPFGVVGALVPELLLEARPARMTNDVDVMVVVQTLADFETQKDQLAAYGFERTRVSHRLRHTTGGLLDILPCSESIAPDPAPANARPPSSVGRRGDDIIADNMSLASPSNHVVR